MTKNRLWIAVLLISVVAVLAACTSPATTTNENTAGTEEVSNDNTGGEATQAAAENQVEVFSWWTGGGEAAGLEAMLKVFQQKNPDIEFVNAAVAGGAGTNAKAVLATRLAAGDPPDSWQAHAGWETIGTYVAANQVEP